MQGQDASSRAAQVLQEQLPGYRLPGPGVHPSALEMTMAESPQASGFRMQVASDDQGAGPSSAGKLSAGLSRSVPSKFSHVPAQAG